MKKLLSILLAGCMLAAFIPYSVAADNGVTVNSSWQILTSDSPTEYERFAAEKLQSCLSEVFGAEISIVSEAADHYIAVGGASSADVSAVAANGYRITVIDGNIHIGGTAQRGLQAGAYRFLEEFCGRKVYTSNLTVMPKADSITVPADTDIIYTPYFEYTDTDWRSPRDPEYSMANSLNGGTYRRLSSAQGGTVDYIAGFCHTMGALCETEKYKDTHPEYLALHDGVRTTEQPCLSNPDVVRICTENVLNILAQKHDPDAPLQIVSVTQNDNFANCECDDCVAFEAAHGGKPSASVVNFANQIADAVKDAGYDNVAIDTFAYYYSQSAPEGIVPRDNVIIRLCSINCCFACPLDQKHNADFYKDLQDWSKICNRLYIWDYTTNYAHTCAVFPDFGVIQRNMQIFYENNVKGVYEEGNYYIDRCDTEFAELRAYMLSKCLQDPYCDLESEVSGFCDAYYGPGGKNIKKIVDLYTRHAGSFDGLMHIYYGSLASMRIPAFSAAAIEHLWRRAKNAAENETQLNNIKRSELSWRWWKASAGKYEFSFFSCKRGDEKEKLYQDLLDAGVKMWSEGGSTTVVDSEIVRYTAPDHWGTAERFEKDTTAQQMMKYEKLAEKFPPLFGIFAYFNNLFKS